jgi:hypothetical protein
MSGKLSAESKYRAFVWPLALFRVLDITTWRSVPQQQIKAVAAAAVQYE